MTCWPANTRAGQTWQRWSPLAAVPAFRLLPSAFRCIPADPVSPPGRPACAAAAGALMLASRGEELDIRTRTSIGLLTTAAAAGDVADLGAGEVLVIGHQALTDH